MIGVALGSMGLALSSGCKRSPQENATAEATVFGQVIPTRVIDDIVATQKLSRDEAIELAADQLRLSIAYRQEHSNPNAPFALEEQVSRYLKQKKRVRLWLKEKFEPSHRAEDIPASVLNKNLDDPKVRRQHFFPRLHGYCQVVVVWKSESKEGSPAPKTTLPQDFQARARHLVAPFVRALERNEAELKAAQSCDRFDRLAKFIDRKKEPQFEIRVERALLDLSQENWDQDFRRAVSPAQSHERLEPFMTQFGLHVVYVLEVMPARLPDDSLPARQLRQKREEWLRKKMAPAYRRSAMGERLEALRKEKYLRFYRNPESPPPPSGS